MRNFYLSIDLFIVVSSVTKIVAGILFFKKSLLGLSRVVCGPLSCYHSENEGGFLIENKLKSSSSGNSWL